MKHIQEAPSTNFGDIRQSLNQQRPIKQNDITLASSRIRSIDESALFELQTACTQPGFRTLHVATEKQADQLVTHVLLPLLAHNTVATIGRTSSFSTAGAHTDSAYECELAYKEGRLEEFVLQNFYYDSLIIYATKELLQTAWFARLEALLIEFNIVQTTSIVILFY